jgi:hypothetical protein
MVLILISNNNYSNIEEIKIFFFKIKNKKKKKNYEITHSSLAAPVPLDFSLQP